MYQLPELTPSEILMYLRKSRTDDPSFSVADTLSRHERMLDDFSQRTWGGLVPESNRFREVVSGETIAARPEMQTVLRLVEQPRFRALLIVEPQRLSRGDLEDIGRIIKIFRYTGTLVLTLQGAFDLTDERDRDFFERELMRGNDYLEYQKRIMGNGRVASIERGNYLGTVAPYGYRRVWVREGKKKAPTLEIEPGEAETVLLIFQMYADGHGASAICAALNAQGILPRSASAWRRSSVYAILDNPVYIGMVRWWKTREVRTVVDGELETQRVNQPDPLLTQGKHPAIIPGALWAAVRARRDARNLPRVKSSREPINPFAGLVRCSCGAAIVLWAANPKVSPRLRCLERHVCGCASCRYQDFVAAVAEAVKANLDNYTAAIESPADTPSTAEVSRLEKRVAALEAKETSLWEKYAEGMPRSVFEELMQKNTAAKQATVEALSAERALLADRESLQEHTVALHEMLDMLAHIDDIPVKAAGRVLRACIRRITYHRAPAVKQAGGNRGGWNSAPIELSIELAF